MVVNRVLWPVACFCALLIASTPDARAADWKQKSFKVKGGGELELEYPESWGRKPEYNTYDTITDLRFGPFGPKEKPVFYVLIQSVLALDPISDEGLLEITGLEIANFREMAFETDIPIKELEGPNMVARYFSITDSDSKRGEFDYLTMAVIRSGRLLVKCYFFSSRGAPSFGADAIRMMQGINYIAPEPKPERE